MKNAEIAAAFDELGTLYELDGAVIHRVLAYRNAAKAIRDSGKSVEELAAQGRATDLAGVGKTIAEKIDSLLADGDIPAAVKLRERIPPGLVQVTRIPGLGPKRAKLLHDQLGIASLDDLRQAAEAEQLRTVAGFGVALARGAELLMEMDSDFSHDPADLPRLVAATADADLVLGSRYVPGGGVTDWGVARRAISRGGSLYAQLILGIPVRDLTGGFKCFRRAVLEGLDLSAVGTDGYGFQIEVTYRAVKSGFRVREVPIVFRDRRVGASKMSWRIALEAFWKVPLLRLHRG